MQKKAIIFQINASDGGVPKRPLREADVNELGLIVDRQRDTRHHGGPQRALCLYALERIQALQQEGHPIYPGAIGENVTISGLDWEQVVPGKRLRLGPTIEIEITSYAVPCQNIRHSFAGEAFRRVSQKEHPGWARVYARVVQTGSMRIGDPVKMDVDESRAGR